MLIQFAVSVCDVVTASKMIRMIKVYILFYRCITLRVASWLVLLHLLTDDACRSRIDMLCIDFFVSYCKVLVHINRLALRASFDDSLSSVIVFICLLMAIVKDALYAVLFIPGD